MTTLIIAEKPSVCRDIAEALGVPKANGVYENSSIIVSHCVGHLVTIYSPEEDDRTIKPPILPERFMLRAIAETADQFRVVKGLMGRSDVDTVVNACDAGREGEAIFRLTYELAGCKKPMQRMWLQSMTSGAIKQAWADRKPGSDYDNLAAASRSRAEADWIVGINGSRAFYRAVGRVMTPTLALVVRRFLEIQNFKPTPYFEVHGEFALKSGRYVGKLLAEKNDGSENPYRFLDKEKAKSIVAQLDGNDPSSVTDESKPTKSSAPQLFDLTTLQREANKRFKFSAKKTLDIAQALYEKHKATSYPRTDSCCLPEDYVPKASSIVKSIGGVNSYAKLSQKIIDNGWVKPSKRIFNDAKISDHFAIIPTGLLPNELSQDEQKIFDLVCRRFLAIFFPDAEYLATVRSTVVCQQTFRTTGRVLQKQGWLEVYGGQNADEGKEKEPALPALQQGETGETVAIDLVSLETKPPALYTEASLLLAMETAGKLVEDENLADGMKERGLGTPATRAATIEKLLAKRKTSDPFMRRDGNSLVPNQVGIELIGHLEKHADILTRPDLTGEWEYRLLQMEKGSYSRAEFMARIKSFVSEVVSAAAASGSGQNPSSPSVALQAKCPKCDAPGVQWDKRAATCGQCSTKYWTSIAGKTLGKDDVETLLSTRALPPISGFKSKQGKLFSAGLRISEDGTKVEFVFEASGGADSGKETTLSCPVCQKKIKDNGKSLGCECGFRLWLEVAGKKLTQKNVSELLSKGRTAEISGFKSNAGKPFSASLLLDKQTGKISFEFPKK